MGSLKTVIVDVDSLRRQNRHQYENPNMQIKFHKCPKLSQQLLFLNNHNYNPMIAFTNDSSHISFLMKFVI